MRADRLVAVLLLLQRRQLVTAAEVAEELEISERTARRDLEALSAAGIPIYSQPGRGGGWRLVGGARTDLSGLTAAEARTLFVVAGPSAAATPELRSALRKLVQALPAPFRAEAESAAASIVVDPDRWGGPTRGGQPSHLEALQRATIAGRQVRLGYAGRNGEATTRIVHPLGLVIKAMVWYLVAGTEAGRRTFRVDRVTSVEQLDESVTRPDDFDLQAAWEEIRTTVDELRAPVRVEARVDPEVVEVLRWMFDRHMEVGPAQADGRHPVTLAGWSATIIASQVAGFGARIEIEEPIEAREHLATIGRQLRATYERGEDAAPSGSSDATERTDDTGSATAGSVSEDRPGVARRW